MASLQSPAINSDSCQCFYTLFVFALICLVISHRYYSIMHMRLSSILFTVSILLCLHWQTVNLTIDSTGFLSSIVFAFAKLAVMTQ